MREPDFPFSREELGVRYPTVLAQAAYGVLAGLAFTAVLLLVLWFPSLAVLAIWERLRVLGVAFGVVATGVLAGVLRLVLAGGAVFSWRTGALWGVLLVLFGLLLGSFVMLGGLVRETGKWGKRLLFVGVPLLTALVAPLSAAWDDAQRVASGQAVPSRFFAPLFPWEARIAEWKRGKMQSLDTCVLYLGESSAGAVIYATDADGHRRLLRVPAAAGPIVVMPNDDRCHWDR